MKHTLTRLLALVLCLCLLVPFAGCGKNEEPAEQPDTSDVSTDPIEGAVSTEATEYTGEAGVTDYTEPTGETEYTNDTGYTEPTTVPMDTEPGLTPESTASTAPTQTNGNTTVAPQASNGTTQVTTKAPANGTTQATTTKAADKTTNKTNATSQAPTYTVPTYTYPTYTYPTYTYPTAQVTQTPDTKPTQGTTKAPNPQGTTSKPILTATSSKPTTQAPTTQTPTQAPTTQAPTTTNGKKPIVTFTTTTEWTTTTTAAPKNPLRVLSIGHSFSKDAMEAYLWDLLDSSGKYDYIVCAYLFYPGCPLDGQWDRINGNIDPETGYAYEYQQYRKTDPYYGSWSTQYKPENYKNLAAFAIKDEDWDVITIQPSPDYGAGPEVCKGKNDYGHVGDIVNWINKSKTNKKAQIYYHMTWAFAEDCRLWSFSYSNYDQMQMYNDFVNATKKYIFGAHPGKFAGIIPAGTSIQNARSSRLGDVFNMPGNYDANADGYHLNDRGDLVAALTWYSVLTGKSAATATCPAGYESEFDIFTEAVDAAIKSPYTVTESTHK